MKRGWVKNGWGLKIWCSKGFWKVVGWWRFEDMRSQVRDVSIHGVPTTIHELLEGVATFVEVDLEFFNLAGDCSKDVVRGLSGFVRRFRRHESTNSIGNFTRTVPTSS